MANEKLIDANKALEILKYEAEVCNSGFTRSILNFVAIRVESIPTVDAVEVEKYKALVEMYHDLRENFIDYVCSGTCNVAPYCLNRCEGCVDRLGWCIQGSDECHGFNPAEVILDDAKMDGDGNGTLD